MKSIQLTLSLILLTLTITFSTEAATLNVPSQYSTIQAAVDAANPGDTIIVQAGITYSESVVLRYKPGADYITIQSSALSSLPPAGQRVGPSDSQYMPKIVPSGVNEPAFSTEITGSGPSHHYRLIGLEIAQSDPNQIVYTLVRLGSGDSDQDALSKVAHDFEINRCYIHATTTGEVRQGIALNSSETTISDSYISDIKNAGADAQAIIGWNGPGPFTIINNYLEGAGENVMFGGGDPHIQNLVPSDIEFRRNLLSKPIAWHTSNDWDVRNLFELKNAKQMTITENIFENNWPDSQSGFSIVFTVRNQDGTAPWSTVEDISLRWSRKAGQKTLSFLLF